MGKPPKPIHWVGTSRQDLQEFPAEARLNVGHALYMAQLGEKAPNAKVLTGLVKGAAASLLEVVTDHDGDTYRTVYTVRFAGTVYVLHAFQKKSKRGIGMTEGEKEMIRKRYKIAADDYAKQKGGK